MTQLGNYHVKQSTNSPANGRPQGPVIALAVVALIVVAVGLYWYLSQESDVQPEQAVADVDLSDTSPPTPLVEPESVSEPIELPTLDDSDALARDLAAGLSSHPGLASWLVTNSMIRRFAVVVDNVGSGNNPSQHLRFMEADTPFRTTSDSETLQADPANYARYNVHAAIIGSLDTTGTAEAYATLEPLLNAAYAELGYPDTPFVQGLERAVRHLLQAPDLREPHVLVERAPFFNHVDPTLEALSAAQKQFLGMGPKNVRIVQAKLRQIAIAIGIPDRRLP